MPAHDPRTDAYIASSPAMAQPVLTHLRAVVHAACPEVEETIKWGMPHFMYQGMLCHMAAFKAHCAFGFWKGVLLFPGATKESMGDLGKITSIKDLPSKKVLSAYVRQAMQFNDADTKPATPAKSVPPALVVPGYLAAALTANEAAQQHFDAGSPSFKREYVAWLEEAKTEPTRQRRLEQALAWLAEGKSRNWKYQKC